MDWTFWKKRSKEVEEAADYLLTGVAPRCKTCGWRFCDGSQPGCGMRDQHNIMCREQGLLTVPEREMLSDILSGRVPADVGKGAEE